MADRVGQQLGHYRLLRVLGHGAFADVYLAEHQYLERPAAIKVLHVQMDPQTQEQFQREARTIGHLHHPHIVQVLDFGLDDYTPYLVMEYPPGGTLRSRHPKGARLPVEQIVTYVKQIAWALDYAHQQGVIHRDVKPENMLLDAHNEIVLSDFGLAVVQRSLDSLSTQNPAGTPLYMAPEQIRGKPCAASDQYALGVVVYEWLCGEPPFRGSLFEVYSQHLYQPPPRLRTRLADLPAAVEEVVLAALTKEPHQRFARVQDFAERLEEACGATQLLSLHFSTGQEPHTPGAPPVTLAASLPAPAARASDRTVGATQPLLRTAERTSSEHEPVPLLTPRPAPPSDPASRHVKPSVAQTNRERLLRKVRAFWITGVLEHSLHGAAFIALGLDQQPEAVAHPWQLVLHHPAGVPRSLPEDTRISQVYDAAAGELLILGAPGSGKTTLLLELARELLTRAEQDEQHPLPVVFNLSSWAMKQQPLADWLVEELNRTYQVPRPLGQAWVDADQILPLLDGLDEVAPKDRTQCIETINTYRQEHGLLPLVACSRSADYLTQSARVRLGSAVMVQPLTQQQVDDYLASGGESLWTLRVALHQDAGLRELTSTPLMLSILTLTHHGMPVEELLSGASPSDRQRQIFEHYVERMLRQRRAAMRYTPEQIIHWLSRLAAQMKRQNQTVFYLEQMQADWLSGSRMLGVYEWWAIRLPSMLIGVLITLAISTWFLGFSASRVVSCILLGGLFGGLLSGGSATQRPETDGRKARRAPWRQFLQRLLIGILSGLGMGLNYGLLDVPQYTQARTQQDVQYVQQHLLHSELIVGLSYGLSVGLCSILLQVLLVKRNIAQSSFQTLPSMWRTKWQRLFRSTGLRNGLLAGLLAGLSFGLGGGLLYGLSIGLSDGLNVGLGGGLSGGLLSLLLIGRSATIQLTDRLIWSWKSLGRSLWSSRHRRATLQVAALSGLSVGLSYGLISGLSVGLSYGLSVGLISGLSYWLLFGLFQGVSSETIEDQHRVVPNQGIRRSAFNGVVLGLISAMISGLSVVLTSVLGTVLFNGLLNGLSGGLSVGLSGTLSGGLSVGLLFELGDELGIWLSVGLSVGLLTGLLKGGWTCLRHYVLRVLLWRSGAIPWNYPHFLDDAAERILLRKVGGGYIFVHRLLLEYFASLDTTPTPDAARAKK